MAEVPLQLILRSRISPSSTPCWLEVLSRRGEAVVAKGRARVMRASKNIVQWIEICDFDFGAGFSLVKVD